MPAPASLARFREQYFGPVDHYLGWHDGYEADLDCLDGLAPTAQQQAEQELLASLHTGRADPRTLLGLGHLRSRPALPALHEYLLSAGGYALPAIARTDPAALDQPLLRHALQTAGEYQLTNLLVGLRTAFTLPQLLPETVAQVWALLGHPRYLARYHALHTLRRLHHLPKAALEHSDDLAAVRRDPVFRLISDDGQPGRYAEAQELLAAEVAAITP